MALDDGTWIECSLLTGWLRALRERSCNTPHKGMPVCKRQGADANLWPCLTRYQQPANKLPMEWSEPAADFGPLPPIRYQQPANKLLKEWSEPAADFGPPLPHSLALVLGVRKNCGICFVISGLWKKLYHQNLRESFPRHQQLYWKERYKPVFKFNSVSRFWNFPIWN